MFTKFLRKNLFSKIIAMVVCVGFVFTNMPLSYARTDSLRPPAAKRNPGIMHDLEHAAVANEFNQRFDTPLKQADASIINSIVEYYRGLSVNARQTLYELLQHHESALAAKAIAAIGFNWSGVVPKLVAKIKGSIDANPRAAARQLMELATEGTYGGLNAPDEVVSQAKAVWQSNSDFQKLTEPTPVPELPKLQAAYPGVLVLVRHGETSWSEAVLNKWAGWHDSKVTPKGLEEAFAAGERIKDIDLKFDKAYSSDFSRAKDTLTQVLKAVGQVVPAVSDRALRERDYGDMIGWNRKDVGAVFGEDALRNWRRGYSGYSARPLGGENLADVQERTLPFHIQNIMSDIAAGKNVVVSAHGNSLRSILVYQREQTEGRKLSEKEILELEVPLSVPIVITFDNDLHHKELWVDSKKGPADVVAFLKQTPFSIAQKLNIDQKEIVKARDANKVVYTATGGVSFGDYTNRIAEQRRKGDLSTAEFKAENIFDSRKKPTARAIIKIGDIEVVGEVPAGASKGKDEAPTVDIDKAISNIVNEIAPALRQSGLDLSKHTDLLKADKMLADKVKDWGANATVPVSWALWKMAAKLNNMQLWEYIRWNEPEVFANGPAYFYMNIYNGGLHALKGGEQLGKDRIDIQEIMIAPVGAKSHAEALAMGDEIDQALKKILELQFTKSDITRADEAGFSVKGLGDSSEAIGYVLQAIKKAGYKPGVDVKLCLDVAATSFYNEEKNVYEFRGREVTSEEMIQYYRGLAEKYTGQIVSIEDGLAENDWEGWKKLTEAMESYGILTIGDDLFVTQMPRLTKGIAEKAATAILIKVNQNGTVAGTLDVIKLAKENGLKFVISHRSGETLDNAIADLAYATRALGLKTGDPQPRVDFVDANQLVRRAKYERMVEIEKNAQTSGKVLIVTPDCFRIGGMNNALQELEKLNGSLKIALYGEKADKLKVWLGNKNIITAGSLSELLEELSKIGVTSVNTLVLKAPGEEIDEAKLTERKIRIVSGDIATLVVAKAVKELVGDANAKDAFEKLLSEAEGKVIEKISDDTKNRIIDKLIEGTFIFPAEVKVTEQVTKDTESARLASAEFMDMV